VLSQDKIGIVLRRAFHAQNQDLADRMTRALQDQARALVASEIRRQMRPGGMLRRGS